MEKFLVVLDGNPWLNIVFLILAIISILISFILYFRSKKEKIPLYNIKHFNLVRGRLKELKSVKISYRGEDVEDLTLTRLAFWNKGRDTIEHRDIAPADPLRITVPEDCRILEVNIDYIHNPVNNIEVKLSDDKTSALLQFDYLHTLEGCVLTIYHTAVGSTVNMMGTIKGAGKIKNGVLEKDYLSNALLERTLLKIIPKRDGTFINQVIRKIIITPLAFVFVPVLFIIQPIELALRLMYRSPPQFTLEDTE